MRLILSLFAAAGLTACAAPEQTPPPASTDAPGTGQVRARFAAFPDLLFFAAAAACNGPGQEVVRPSRNELRCESLPPPELAAALILQYGGTVDDLPRFVDSFSVASGEADYVVTADSYVRVPQGAGRAVLLRLPDAELEDAMAEAMTQAGGRTI